MGASVVILWVLFLVWLGVVFGWLLGFRVWIPSGLWFSLVALVVLGGFSWFSGLLSVGGFVC